MMGLLVVKSYFVLPWLSLLQRDTQEAGYVCCFLSFFFFDFLPFSRAAPYAKGAAPKSEKKEKKKKRNSVSSTLVAGT